MDEIKDHCMKSVLQFYNGACTALLEDHKDTAIMSSNRVFDCMNSYLIYTCPFMYLHEDAESVEQFVHDCYVLTSAVIESSTISSQYKNIMKAPLNSAAIYPFSSKAYSRAKTKGFKEFLTETLRMEEYEDTEKLLIYKELVRPLTIFVLTLFPLNRRNKESMNDSLEVLYDYIKLQVGILHEVVTKYKLLKDGSEEKPWEIVLYAIMKIVKFMKDRKYQAKNIAFTLEAFSQAYKGIAEKKFLEADNILKGLNKIDKVKLSKKKTSAGEKKNVRRTSKPKKPSTPTVSRKKRTTKRV